MTGLMDELIRNQNIKSGLPVTATSTGQPRQYETQVGRFDDA
jgi:hypothetical protein